MGSKGRRAPATRLVITFSVICGIAILVNLGFDLVQSRAEILAHNVSSAVTLTRVLEQQTSDSLNAVDLALQATERAVRNAPSRDAGTRRVVEELLVDSVSRLPFVRAMWVLDAEGNTIYHNARRNGHLNLADRDYFRMHREHSSLGLFIDRPLVGRSGVAFIGLSRRIELAGGGFGGVAVAALKPAYLRRFYDSIRPGRDGMISLVHDNGTLMLRVPEVSPEALAQGKTLMLQRMLLRTGPVQEGQFTATSPIDGVERLYFYRRVNGRPLVVSIGLGKDELLAGWRRGAFAYSGVAAGFLLLIFWMSRLTVKELRYRNTLNLALAQSDAEMRAAQRLARIGSWRLDLDTMHAQWSEEMFRVLGLAPGPVAPSFDDFVGMIHPDDRELLTVPASAATGWAGELRTNPALGPVRHLHARCTPLADLDGRISALMGTLQDVTEQHRAEEKLRLSARVFEHTGDGIVVADAACRIVAVNAAFERITGYQEGEVLQQSPLMLHTDLYDQSFIDALEHKLNTEGQWRGEVWSRRKNGEVFPEWLIVSTITDDKGRLDGFVAVFSDLSEIRNATAQLQFLSNHDPLTRLPNRSLFNDRLLQAIETAAMEHRQLGVLLLNIDRLKRINEGIGHEAGDQLLRETGRRLLTKLQPGDTLARLGSDEFVMLLTHVDDADDINAAAQQLLELVAQPFQVAGHELTVTASIGIALYPEDGATPSDLLKNADTALAHVKESGSNGFRYFTGQMNIRALHWMSIEHRLRGASGRNELMLHYQPQMALNGNRLSGVEALLRWQSPTLGLVPPTEFIPVAEDTGLIIAIGEWVLHTACAQGRSWRDAGMAPVRIAVNVSAHQIATGNVPALVREALRRSGMTPQCLAIELTESVLMKEADSAMSQIAELRAMGVAVALDDFGTGYSSLGYLSRFALDKIKLDQSLVRNITRDDKSDAIARASIGLAHGLGLSVVAEGVERPEQLDFLRTAQCDEIQGYLFSRPLPPQLAAESMKEGAYAV
jgi:diguanylate cyclase (GGDEF)-like protein/PAS domain S-box-containing protein